jgi:hypothetical protein
VRDNVFCESRHRLNNRGPGKRHIDGNDFHPCDEIRYSTWASAPRMHFIPIHAKITASLDIARSSYGGAYNAEPATADTGWQSAVHDIELDAAIDVSERPDKPGFRVYAWEEPLVTGAAPRREPPSGRSELRLRSASCAVNLLGKKWEFALSNIFISLEEPQRSAAPFDPGTAPPACTHNVFIQCLEEDREDAYEIRRRFFQRGVWAWFLPQPLAFWTRKRPLPGDERRRGEHQAAPAPQRTGPAQCGGRGVPARGKACSRDRRSVRGVIPLPPPEPSSAGAG